MIGVLHELDNDAVLILFAAGELAGEDRAEVEHLLSTDAGLRAGLASARADAAAVAAAFDGADRVDPPAGTSASAEAAALRRVGRAARQWQAMRAVRSRPAAVPERQPHLPAWAYQAGVAAAVLLVAVGWWRWESRPGPPVDRGDVDFVDDGSHADRLAEAVGLGGGPNSELAEAERQAASLRRGDEAPDTAVIFRDGSAD